MGIPYMIAVEPQLQPHQVCRRSEPAEPCMAPCPVRSPQPASLLPINPRHTVLPEQSQSTRCTRGSNTATGSVKLLQRECVQLRNRQHFCAGQFLKCRNNNKIRKYHMDNTPHTAPASNPPCAASPKPPLHMTADSEHWKRPCCSLEECGVKTYMLLFSAGTQRWETEIRTSWLQRDPATEAILASKKRTRTT